MGAMTLNDSKQRSKPLFWYVVPIDFSYTTSYRLSILTFCYRTHRFGHDTFRTDRGTDATLYHSATVSTVG